MPGSPPAAPTPSAELARLIARGDRRRAAALLVHEHAPAVFALCRAMVRDARLAEDLSQDAFARAFGALDGFRAEASPRTWLLAIARNRCIDHLLRARRAPWADGDDGEPDDHAADEPPPFDLLSRREDAERAMAVLGESERALVVLHFGHGVGYPELADSFGLRQGAVRMRISRALAKMREALREEPWADVEADDDLATSTFEQATSRRGGDFDELARGRAAAHGDALSGRRTLDREADFDDDFETIGESAPPADADAVDEADEPTPVRRRAAFDASRAQRASLDASRARAVSRSEAQAAPVFDALREEVPPLLRARLAALAGAV
jgi:RNA polymerase sigma-70 factor (ECF subfamily)